MRCFFCQSLKHLSENCNIYPTLQSRYSKLNWSFRPCFCRKVPADPDYLYIELCNCRSLCDICLQHHHKSLCPKADPKHPFFSNYISEQIKLLSLDYLIFKRFLELCNPIDKIKLSFCCKYLSKFLPIEFKLRSFEYGSASSYLNCIGIGRAVINEKEVLEAYKKDLYPNFPYFYVQDISITKSDLIFFAKSDPIYVNFTNCTYDGGLCFYDFIQNFPHIIGINISYNMLPKTWIKDFINTKRYILLRCIDVYSVGVFPDNIDLNELVELFKINKDLILTFYMGHNLNFSEAWKKIEKIMNHKRFAVSSNKNRCCVEFIIGESRMMFSFNRNGL